MKNNCEKYLSTIAISIVISFVFTLLFYNGIITNFTYAIIFSIILAIISFIILTILGSSDNGFTRTILCQYSIFLLVSILGNIFSNIFALVINLSPINILSSILIGIAFFFFVLNIFGLSILLISILRYE